jgi:DNA repair exonuclease SbcCD ATPase subunit
MIKGLLQTSSEASLPSLLPPIRSETTGARLSAERRAIGELEQRVEHLREQRSRRLVEDDVAAAVRIEDEIAAIGRELAVHRDRLPILRQRLRQEVEDRRQQEKTRALVETKKRLAARTDAAKAIDTALAQLQEAFAAYAAVDAALLVGWPADYPDRQLYAAPSNMLHRIGGVLGMPTGSAVRLKEIATRVGSIAEADAAAAASMLASIKDWPLPERQIDEAAA